jgi:hypothetical protein
MMFFEPQPIIEVNHVFTLMRLADRNNNRKSSQVTFYTLLILAVITEMASTTASMASFIFAVPPKSGVTMSDLA